MKKKTFSIVFLLAAFIIAVATIPGAKAEELPQTGEVIKMNKAMFIEKVCDYENVSEWKYKGDKPAIIDLYADWCGPCRRVAPILKQLAQEYKDEIIIYKVDIDKEKELARLFNATSIPLFVFIPMNQEPQLFKGAANKETYIKVIEQFLLGKKPK